MKLVKVDLYEYFNVKKPNGAKGILSGYIIDKSEEVDINRKSPAMLVIPGGGYAMVSFREAEPVCLKYLSYGFCAFCLDYSVTPVHYPYQLAEALMAVAYIRKNAEEFKIDENMISAIGFSAGGHLTAMLGSYSKNKEVEEVFKTEINLKVNAIVLGYPVITSGEKSHFDSFRNLCGENQTLIEKLSIENLVTETSAPAFIFATYNDNGVPVKNSLIVANAYEEKGVPFSLHIFGKGPHGLSVADETIYGTTWYKELTSQSYCKWVELSVEWLKEMNVKVI